MKKLIIASITVLFTLPLIYTVDAQTTRYDRYDDDPYRMWSLGLAYEIRNEDPSTGFGIRLERDVIPPESPFRLSTRAHFSYFVESVDVEDGGVTVDADVTSYDFGIALVAGAELGLAKPYVGLGVGTENFEVDSDDPDSNFDENNFYWNGFGGLELILSPAVRPFIEYRITRLDDPDEVDFDNVNRLSVGLSFRF